MPAPGTGHQEVLLNLATLVHGHVRSRALGKVLVAPTDCILSDITVLQPDVLFVATAHLARVTERAVEGAPTLAVEVLSPSTASAIGGASRRSTPGTAWPGTGRSILTCA